MKQTAAETSETSVLKTLPDDPNESLDQLIKCATFFVEFQNNGEDRFSIDHTLSIDAFTKMGDADSVFYSGKIMSAAFYIRNVLPEARFLAKVIQNKKTSVLEIREEFLRQTELKRTCYAFYHGMKRTSHGGIISWEKR